MIGRHGAQRSKAARLLVIMGLAQVQTAFAHSKWFHDASAHPLQLSSLLTFPTASFLIAALAAVTVAGMLWHYRNGRGFLPPLDRFGGEVRHQSLLCMLLPMILAVHVSIPLFILAVQGKLFAPSNTLPGVWAYVLGTTALGIALGLFYGVFTRVAALVLGLLWLAGTWVIGLESMLENIHYLGFSGFFYLVGRGPFSLDRLLFPRFAPPIHNLRHALVVMRVGVGLSLVVAAFTEKLANVSLGEAFLAEHALNFTAALGLPIPDTLFILGAGTVELVIGLLLIFGIFHREALLLAWLPFNLTVTVFSWTELIGHLPFYGAMLILLAHDTRWVARSSGENQRTGSSAPGIEQPERVHAGQRVLTF
jgi:uncharacterized membrane protein YphA (DoxX/SURF4 family)